MTNGTRRTAAGFETTKFDKFFSISLSCGFIDTEAEAAGSYYDTMASEAVG
jgi:hypothetical protein